jgi:hypothetical protein
MVSSRPVDLAELSEIVAIKPGTSIFSDIDRLFDPKDLLVVCSSLITHSPKNLELSHYSVRDFLVSEKLHGDWVQLSHYSVREFLISERMRGGPARYFAIRDSEAHLAIAQRCLTYLLSFDQPVIPIETEPESLHSSTLSSTSTLAEHLTLYEQLFVDYPLLEYSACEWSTHARLLPSEHQAKIEPMILRLLDQNNSAFQHWISLCGLGEETVRPGNALYYASKLGLSFVVQTLLSQDADVDYIGGQYGSPLSGASFFGHYDVVRILLENGSNVNIQAGVFNTPLRESIPDCRISIKIESVTKLKKKKPRKTKNKYNLKSQKAAATENLSYVSQTSRTPASPRRASNSPVAPNLGLALSILNLLNVKSHVDRHQIINTVGHYSSDAPGATRI